jgi:hypothetical protein
VVLAATRPFAYTSSGTVNHREKYGMKTAVLSADRIASTPGPMMSAAATPAAHSCARLHLKNAASPALERVAANPPVNRFAGAHLADD